HDLARPRRLPHLHQLVPGGHERDLRTSVDGQPRKAQRRRQADLSSPEGLTAPNHDLALAQVVTWAVKAAAGREAGRHHHTLIPSLATLAHHTRAGPSWQYAAGQYAGGGPRRQLALKGPTRRGLAGYPQPSTAVLGPDRVAVHSARGKRW